MSKQEEIREGIDKILWEFWGSRLSLEETKRELSELGVVIKDYDPECLEYIECGSVKYYKVESLIKEGE